MTYLADACALLAHFGAGAASMSRHGRAVMRGDLGDVCISPVTIWELTRKAAIGKLPPLPRDGGSFANHLRALGFSLQHLLWDDGEMANRLPSHHKDPMDRMLIATALRADLTIITSDSIFAAYGVKTLW